MYKVGLKFAGRPFARANPPVQAAARASAAARNATFSGLQWRGGASRCRRAIASKVPIRPIELDDTGVQSFQTGVAGGLGECGRQRQNGREKYGQQKQSRGSQPHRQPQSPPWRALSTPTARLLSIKQGQISIKQGQSLPGHSRPGARATPAQYVRRGIAQAAIPEVFSWIDGHFRNVAHSRIPSHFGRGPLRDLKAGVLI